MNNAEGTTNSLSDLLSDMMRREKNSLEIIDVLQKIYTSKNDKVVISYTGSDNVVYELTVPSMGFLISEITRVSNNLQNISGLGARNAMIKLPDGGYRQIFSAEIPAEPNSVVSVPKPTLFYKRNNSIFDELLFPTVFIKFNVQNQIPINTEEVMVRKVILNLDTQQNIDYFNTKVNGVNIEYNTLIADLDDEGITANTFDEVIPMPPRLPKFSGVFDVLQINKRDVTETVNNKVFNQKKVFYKLSTLLYRDLDNGGAAVTLKVGNTLIVNAATGRNTKYRIDTIDVSVNEVSLKLIEGYDSPIAGSATLMIDPGFSSRLDLEVKINTSNYMVIFFKPLSLNGKVVSTSWGSGTGLYTSDLIDVDDQTNGTKLSDYYESSVLDIGGNLRDMARNKVIPLSDGIIPDAPLLIADNFKVTQINTHKENNKSAEELRNKFADKNRLQSEIAKTDTDIEKQKRTISTGNFRTTGERTTAKKALDDAYSKRALAVNEYDTVVNAILSRTRDVQAYSPKYAIRGFWSIPVPKYSDDIQKIGKQEVVNFIYSYRYLKVDNTSTEADNSDFKDTTGKVNKATFSKWEETKTKVRGRKLNTETNKPEWIEEDTKDPDIINTNQLSIPITFGESVEIRVRSVSEAGYPYAPLQSEWSNTIIVKFPDELRDNVDSITTEATDDSVRSKFLKELTQMGVNDHLKDSVQVGDTYFTHSATTISTSFKTPENKPKDADTVFREMKNELDELKAKLSGEKGAASITITDEFGNHMYDVSNNDTVTIFAGYYKDMVAGLAVQKGAIITKLYYIEISNLNAADLELLSYIPGLYTDRLPNSTGNASTNSYSGYLINTAEFNGYRRYDKVPISLRAVTESDADFTTQHVSGSPFVELPTFQSQQVKGQFIFSRYRDITLNTTLLQTGTQLLPIFPTSGTQQNYIWDPNATAVGGPAVGDGYESDFCVHMSHPALETGSTFLTAFGATVGNSMSIATRIPSHTYNSGTSWYPEFINSPLAILDVNQVNGQKQLEYQTYTVNTAGSATIANFARKVGFSSNDQYLIGKNTVGAYLFMAPSYHKSLYTGSQVYNIGQIVKKGDEFVLRVPFIFQARLTDFYGAGNTGTGILGGFNSAPLTNLSYSKKMGVDFVIKDQTIFSFDCVVRMDYKARSIADVTAII